ncbi:MAG: glycosyltransferase family 2 protein [Desulfobacterales bacterium]|nr:glycosyltransferase family 2 protein [Desulfobacterales bacterium]
MKSLLIDGVYLFNWFVLVYFFALNLCYLLFLVISRQAMREYNLEHKLAEGSRLPRYFQKPFTILVPAYNEENTIVDSVHSLVQLDYPEYEVVVINDGSSDQTFELLSRAYELVKVDVTLSRHFSSEPVRGIYYSRSYPRLTVVDKENGGKSDAYNAGTNAARYPYVCCVDADSLLSGDSMFKLMRQFVISPFIVGIGGIIRLSNGCTIRDGQVTRIRMPGKMVEKIQVVEYLRAFLFGRLGWSRLNILMIISGAFGVYRQDILRDLGGWSTSSVVEDMELVLRMQKMIYRKRPQDRLAFAPDPICWTQAPDSLKGLSTQRERWQRGLMDTLLRNLGVLFNIRYRRLGLLGYPYFFFFEFLGPLIEVFGYVIVFASYFLGILDISFLLLFLAVALLWGMFVSLCAVALEESTYHRYESAKDLLWMIAAAVLENFGYRQLHSLWRLKGMIKYVLGKRSGWGTIKRTSFQVSGRQ